MQQVLPFSAWRFGPITQSYNLVSNGFGDGGIRNETHVNPQVLSVWRLGGASRCWRRARTITCGEPRIRSMALWHGLEEFHRAIFRAHKNQTRKLALLAVLFITDGGIVAGAPRRIAVG
jgi:hypothetical protein